MEHYDDTQGIDVTPASLPTHAQRHRLGLAAGLARLLEQVAKEVALEYVRLLEMDRHEPKRHSKRAQRSSTKTLRRPTHSKARKY